MAVSQHIVPEVATATSVVTDIATKASQFRASASEASRGFDLGEAVAAGCYVAVSLYFLAFAFNIAMGY